MPKYKWNSIMEVPVGGEIEADSEKEAFRLAEEEVRLNHEGYPTEVYIDEVNETHKWTGEVIPNSENDAYLFWVRQVY